MLLGEKMLTRKTIAILLCTTVVTFCQTREVRGITEPYKQSTISATVSGRIKKITYPIGAYVQKGNTILELENSAELLEVKRRKLIGKSNSDLISAEYQVATLQKDYNATKELFDSSNSVSEEELWQKDLELKLAKENYQKLLTAEEREKIEFRMAVEELNKRIIQAPFSGTIVMMKFNEGESCNALEPLLTIVDIRKVKFTAHIEAKYSHELKKGANVLINIDGGASAIKVTGTVTFISPVVDGASGLREIQVVFDNKNGIVKPGVSGTMIF